MNVINTCHFAAEPIPQTALPPTPLGTTPVAPANAVPATPPPSKPPAARRRLHRLSEVRRREGLTRRQLARRMGISLGEVRRQEKASADITLSDLYRWQQALDVPITELLSEPSAELSPPVELRAHLLRVMKTARSIEAGARQVTVRRLAAMLVEQLVEVMPELEGTPSWPTGDSRFSDPIEPLDWRLFCNRKIP
jgi:transcriptional regulator with XRE-family HTH domain